MFRSQFVRAFVSLAAVLLAGSRAQAQNDDCATPTVISGVGLFPFDCTGATTGTQGQNEAVCNIYANTSVLYDVWFQWTAPSSGVATLTLCGLLGTDFDTKVAVYLGGGCPFPGTGLACSDDACAQLPPWESEIQWSCHVGTTYTIQLGHYPLGGAIPGTGSFSLAISVPQPPCVP